MFGQVDKIADLPAQRQVLMQAVRLKELARAGWVRVGVEGPESVAAHSWGVGWLAMALCPPELNLERVLAMASVHDLAEVEVGDIVPGDQVPHAEKVARERAALERLSAPLPNCSRLRLAFEEYVNNITPEARFVHACDKLDMALQAGRYEESQGLDLQEFFRSARPVLEEAGLLSLAEPDNSPA